MNTTLSRQALSEARVHFIDWIDRYTTKMQTTPLTLLEEYEYTRLRRKIDEIDEDIATYDANTKKRSFLQIIFHK